MNDERKQKYYQPKSSPIRLYIPPGFKSDASVIRITEGEKKALKGTQEGLNVCGLGGIWNFALKNENNDRDLIEDFQLFNWNEKQVEIIPDGDFQINSHVCHAVYRFGSMLEEARAKVKVVLLPEDRKLDDYLCEHSAEDFLALPRIALEDRMFRPFIIKEKGYVEAIRSSVVGSGIFIKQEFKPLSYIMKPWLKPGVLAMIYAQRGVGKTFLCLALALAVTRKASIGPWQSEQPAGCLYVDSEMMCEDLQGRLEALSEGLPPELAPLHILSADKLNREGWPTPNLLNPVWREALYSFLKETKSHQILILDNLSSLTPGIDENVKQDWDEINQWLLSLRSLRTAVILVHHAGKAGEQRGTSGREDNLDISIKLSRPRGYSPEEGCKFDIEFTKTRSIFGDSAAPFSFQIMKVESRLTWTTDVYGAGMKEKIVALLGRGVSQKDIPDILGCDKSWVSKVKAKAIQDGHLYKDCKFTDEGRRLYGDVEVRELAA